MIDHVSLHVRDLDRALAFYAAALAPLGYTVIMEFPGAAGLGAGGKPDLWLGKSDKAVPVHIALRADRAAVDAFHAAALAAGGVDNGKPGIRAHYHPNYYGAFVLDPEGNNLEAVCHDPPSARRTGQASGKRQAKKATAKKATAKRAAPKKATAKKATAKKATAKKATAKKRGAKR